MQINSLEAISPIDGRYSNKLQELSPYFSERALINYRVKVEMLYFKELCQYPLTNLKDFPKQLLENLTKWAEELSLEDVEKIKSIENVTNHDVKAVEYFIKEKFEEEGVSKFQEFIHFGLTSQDINNTAVPWALKDAIENTYLPILNQLKETLQSQAENWKDIPMLARTHGQPASPTRLGKEWQVFINRLQKQEDLLMQVPYSAKFGGATGNFNAHYMAYPEINWQAFAEKLLSKMGLERSHPTTQIEHYDNLAALLDNLKRINTILIDLSRDIWHYISIEYFKQKINPNEVGSSAMPHKVNPIDFENAEGNLGIANALFEHLSAKLPISRLQRDLTDSTVLRNLGVPIAHTCLAFKSLLKGLSKIELNQTALKQDLENNWAVVAEAIQTVLRREGFPKPYEALKNLTRTQEHITEKSMSNFIETLDISEELKTELKKITPFNYLGK